MGFYFSFVESKIRKNYDKKNINNLKGNNNMFVGAGASIGYNFNILSKYSPIRVEFEYLYKNGLEVNNYPNNIDNINIHSMLFNAYYDINLIYINYDGEENNIYRNGKRHIMTISLGFSLGGNIDYSLSSSLNEKFGLVKNYSYILLLCMDLILVLVFI